VTLLTTPTTIIPAARDIYSLYAGLTALAEEQFLGEPGGKLLLYGAIDARGAALALAGNIAGAATLGVDDDSGRLKQGIRHGFCDFLVNNLDEALRILKNEIRKKQPVSVCLEADFEATLKEIVERGVQPDILGFAAVGSSAGILVERGAMMLEASVDRSFIDVRWFAKALSLPMVDGLAAEVLPVGDGRLRWLKFAPRYLGRSMAGRHFLPMTAGEADAFASLVAAAVAAGKIDPDIVVTREAL
jgi:hypothetical protein